MLVKTWKVIPFQVIVIEILEKKSSLTDAELFEALKAFYKNIGFDDLNKTLMEMEITGLIYVSSFMKGKRLVQLRKRKSDRNLKQNLKESALSKITGTNWA
jgi:hypothetical protein